MKAPRPRLAIVVSHPIQYQAPLYRRLATSDALDLEVLFLTKHGVAPSYDAGFGREIAFDVPLLDGYRHTFVPNWRPSGSPTHPLSVINPGLQAAIARAEADVVLVHGYQYVSHWLAFLASRRRRLPYLMRGESTIESELDRSRLRRRFKRGVLAPVLGNAAGCLAIGSKNRDFYLAYGVPTEKIFHAPYSVDNDAFRASGAKGRIDRTKRLAALNLDPGLPLVLCAAKMVPGKRPFDVEAAVRTMTTPVNVVFVGDGPLRPQLEERVRTSSRTRVLGFVNQQEIGEWYGMAQAYVLPSAGETWGVAVNEAMAAGAVPVVSSAVACAADLVDDETGAVFPCGDTAALARALDRVLASPVEVDRRRQAAARRIATFGVEATADGVERAVAAAVGSRSRSSAK